MKAYTLALFAIVGLVRHVVSQSESDCCKFMITAADFPCPATQLADGQIRFNQAGFNGTCRPSRFCIDNDGAVTDSQGFGCIVTPSPETQIQCDEGKQPQKGFSISPARELQLNGSDNFFACPATDTEWNIYQWPEFGQKKCYGLRLYVSGCAPPKPTTSTSSSASCAASTTTTTITQWMTQMSNFTVTSGCSSPSSGLGWNASTTECHKCSVTDTGYSTQGLPTVA